MKLKDRRRLTLEYSDNVAVRKQKSMKTDQTRKIKERSLTQFTLADPYAQVEDPWWGAFFPNNKI